MKTARIINKNRRLKNFLIFQEKLDKINVNLGILDGNEVVFIISIKRYKILGINLSCSSEMLISNYLPLL
jgi:hypothetical protein